MKNLLLAILFLVSCCSAALGQRFIETQPTLSALLDMDPRTRNRVWFVIGDPGIVGGNDAGIYIYDPTSTTPPGPNVFVPTGPVTTGRWLKISDQIPLPLDASNIADGSISNIEFQSLDGVGGNIQSLFNTKLSLSGGTMIGPVTFLARIVATNVDLTLDEFYVENFIVDGNIYATLIDAQNITLGGVTRSAWPDTGGVTNETLIALGTNTIFGSGRIPLESVVQPLDDTLTELAGKTTVGTGNIVLESAAGGGTFDPDPSFNTVYITNDVKVLAGAGSTNVVNMSKSTPAIVTNIITSPVSFAHVTNTGLSEFSQKIHKFTVSGASPVAFSIPTQWRVNVFTPKPPSLTNGTVTFMYVQSDGPTSSLALQTNVYVSFQYFQ